MQDELHTIVSIFKYKLMGCFVAFTSVKTVELLLTVRLAEIVKSKVIRIQSAGVVGGHGC